MFRRHRHPSALVALIALATFLGASLADARGLDPCPHHDALNLAHYGAAAHDGHDMAGMAGMQGHGGSSDKDQHPHGPCNCVGSCDAGGSPPLVAVRLDLTVALAPVAELTPPSGPKKVISTKDEGWTPYLPQAPPSRV